MIDAEDWHIEHIRVNSIPVCSVCLAEHGIETVDDGKIDIYSPHRIRKRGDEYCYEQRPNGLDMAVTRMEGKK